ncbi:MAG: hypothetical protein JWM16_6379 [Verrucomicrobiales bacterium]|nr:hypothetical protein [Verrucomicrobiales bacterium]
MKVTDEMVQAGLDAKLSWGDSSPEDTMRSILEAALGGKGAMKGVHYEITVWNNTNGDVEKYVADADEKRLAELRDYYEDQPWCEVIIDREWEEEDDDE